MNATKTKEKKENITVRPPIPDKKVCVLHPQTWIWTSFSAKIRIMFIIPPYCSCWNPIGWHSLINKKYSDNFTTDDKTQIKLTRLELRDHGNDFELVYLVLSFTFQKIRQEVRKILKTQT